MRRASSSGSPAGLRLWNIHHNRRDNVPLYCTRALRFVSVTSCQFLKVRFQQASGVRSTASSQPGKRTASFHIPVVWVYSPSYTCSEQSQPAPPVTIENLLLVLPFSNKHQLLVYTKRTKRGYHFVIDARFESTFYKRHVYLYTVYARCFYLFIFST